MSEAVVAQDDRLSDDTWMDAVYNWMSGRNEIRVTDILSQALDIPLERQGKPQEMRIGRISTATKVEKAVSGDAAAISNLPRIWLAPGYNPDGDVN